MGGFSSRRDHGVEPRDRRPLGTRSLRSTASTGFRAPSLPQLGFNTIVFSGSPESGFSVSEHLEDGAAREYFGRGARIFSTRPPAA